MELLDFASAVTIGKVEEQEKMDYESISRLLDQVHFWHMLAEQERTYRVRTEINNILI